MDDTSPNSHRKAFLPARVVSLFFCVALGACEHPLEVVGQGQIVSASGDRDCHWQAQPCENFVQDEYVETYSAEAEEGWKFVGWEGCGDTVLGECSYNVPRELVRHNWGATMSALVANFERTVPELNLVTNMRVGYGQVRGVLKVGSLLYVAAGTSGLYIYEINTDGSLSQLSRYDVDIEEPDGSVRSVLLVGRYLYMANRARGLVVLDVQNPEAPVEVYSHRISFPKATFLQRQGRYLYVSNRYTLEVYDISERANPVHVHTHRAHTEYERVQLDGRWIYAASYYDGLSIIDNSDPTNLVRRGMLRLDGYAIWSVAKQGKYLFAGGEGSGIYTINVSNPLEPTIVNRLELPSESMEKPADKPPFHLRIHRGFLYVADGFSGVQVVDISDPENLALVNSYDTPGYTWDLYLEGLTLLVGDLKAGVHLLDIGSSLDVDGDGIPNYLDPTPN